MLRGVERIEPQAERALEKACEWVSDLDSAGSATVLQLPHLSWLAPLVSHVLVWMRTFRETVIALATQVIEPGWYTAAKAEATEYVMSIIAQLESQGQGMHAINSAALCLPLLPRCSGPTFELPFCRQV